MILPVKVGVKFVIAAQRYHATQANSIWVKYLRTCVNPYLQHPVTSQRVTFIEVSKQDICNVCFIMCAIHIPKALRLARVNEGSHSFTCHPHVWNEASCLYSPATEHHHTVASTHFPLRVRGWVGLGGSVKYCGGLPARRQSPISVLAAAAGKWGTELTTIETQVQRLNL